MPKLFILPSNEHKSRRILYLINSDVCGPMSSISIIGNIYYVSFFYDSSIKAYIYFKKIKDEVSSRFQVFKDIVESCKSKKIKVLRQIKPSQNQCKREKK